MNTLTDAVIKKLISQIELETKSGKNIKEAINTVSNELDLFYEKKAVLGFDIYRYSQFEKLQQTLIPHLFKKLMNITIKNCLKHEPYIFQKTSNKEIYNNFIDSGDGGFLIFETPFHALIFAIYFESNIKRYNSSHILTKDIKNVVGEISLRYSLTYDDLYKASSNYYGSAIINNARIMSKDKLNRFLLDKNSHTWFNESINGIETIQMIDFEKNDHETIKIFNEYTEITDEKISNSLLFGASTTSIIKSDIMHIGEIRSKLDTLDIYSSHIQANFKSKGKTGFDKITISLGNLNSNGISE